MACAGSTATTRVPNQSAIRTAKRPVPDPTSSVAPAVARYGASASRQARTDSADSDRAASKSRDIAPSQRTPPGWKRPAIAPDVLDHARRCMSLAAGPRTLAPSLADAGLAARSARAHGGAIAAVRVVRHLVDA